MMDKESERCRQYHRLIRDLPSVSSNRDAATFLDRALARLMIERVHAIHFKECVVEKR